MNIKKALSESNKNKVLSGQEITSFIVSQLKRLEEHGIIQSFEKNVKFKHIAYDYEDQFLANFVIKTIDGKRIIVRSSNSFRSDRAKIGFYDLDGILRLSNLSDNIISTIYLVSDEELQNSNFVSLREKFRNKEYYCPATHLFTLSEFVEFLQTYYEEKSSLFEDIQTELNFDSLKEAGSYYGIKGNKLENDISKLLNEKPFLRRFKENKESSDYDVILDTILRKYRLNKNDLIKIRSTNSIPLLKNGGNPKTDIFIQMTTADGEVLSETISVKSTTKTKVSCHDYKVKDYIRVLGCENSKLENYLKLFQDHPSYSEFESNLPSGYSIEDFSKLMKSKSRLMTEWCLKGEHDSENLIDSIKQISNFVLLNTKSGLHFFEYDNYINYILKNSKLKFAVPFSWTYPSKQRGKRIQLKMPVFSSIK
ncbi:MAG: MspI family type II restriction endonuclease [Flavobacteriaceae bacterium]